MARAPFATRVYSRLLTLLVPSLGDACAADAVVAFQELEREARAAGRFSHASFLVRELRSLVATALRVRRQRRVGAAHGHAPSTRHPRAPFLDRVRQDLSYAGRTLRRSPGFLTVTVLSLTVAIAVSTLVFSVVNATLFRPIPHVAQPDDLVHVFTTSRRHARGSHSFPDYLDYKARSETLSDLAAVGTRDFAVGPVSRGTRQVWGLQVTTNYFQLLGIQLVRGRAFLPEDVEAGGRVVVIGYNTWQRQFGGAPDVLGRDLYLDGHPHTIVGVAPEGMVALQAPRLVEIVVPLMDFRRVRGRSWLSVVGRLDEGATIPQAQAELDAIASALGDAYPEYWNPLGDDPRGLRVLTNARARIPEAAPLAAVALGVGALVGLLMLVACSNVANLLLTRAFTRRGEIAIRTAIGASARRVFEQLLLENLLLFGVAGGLGLLLAHGVASVIEGGWALPQALGAEISVDRRVALFNLALTLVTGLTFGLLPALQASRPDIVPALKGSSQAVRFRALGMRNLLVGAQVGGSLVLVLVTLLLIRSVGEARSVDLGFDPAGIATLTVDLSHRGYGPEEGRRLYAELVERVQAHPEVEAAGLASWVPLAGGSTSYGGLEPEGYEAGPNEYVSAGLAVVTPGYLQLTRMRLRRGRDFGVEDDQAGPAVALVNESFVARFWPGQDALGKTIGLGDDERLQVIGVVADVPYRDLTSEVGPHIWRPLAQSYWAEMVLHARARAGGDARALLRSMRQEVAGLDPNLPVIRSDLMESLSANATQPHRILSTVLGAAGLFALILAVIGIYGVVAYSVSQRTREMGLRMALGADPSKVIGLVLGEGLSLSLVGLIPGLLLALGASRLIRAFLIGVSPLDPVAFGSSVALLVLAVLGAALLPGIRASRADPVQSLRAE